jgi:hypothetical protein
MSSWLIVHSWNLSMKTFMNYHLMNKIIIVQECDATKVDQRIVVDYKNLQATNSKWLREIITKY